MAAAKNTPHSISSNLTLGEAATKYLISLTPDDRLKTQQELSKFVQYLNARNRSDEALAFLEKQVEQRSQQAMIRRKLAEQYQHLDRIEDAIKQLDTVGEILLDTGDRQGAITAIGQIIALNPPNIDEYKQLLERIKSN